MQFLVNRLERLIRIFREGFGFEDAAGKARLAIARRGIVGTMGESVEDKGPVDPRPDKRVVSRWTTLDLLAWQDSQAQMGGGSSNLDVH